MPFILSCRPRGERGAAAVEAGLITAFLSPLLLGVLGLGNTLWGLQRSHEYEPRVNQSDVVGAYTDCQSLLTAVKNSVLVNVNNVSQSTEVDLDDITAEVVDFVPDQIGVDVRIEVRVDGHASMGWLPFSSDFTVESQTHLDNVRLDVQTC